MRNLNLKPLLLFLIALLELSNVSNAQNKNVIQPNFVSPFPKKQNQTKSAVVRPSNLPQKKQTQSSEYSIEKLGNYSMIKFSESSKINSQNCFQKISKELGMKETDRMILIKTETDKIGFTNYRYQQTINGIAVMGGEYLLHEKNGILISANGTFYNNLFVNTTPNISKENAIQKAIENIGAKKYAWQNPESEKFLQSEKGNVSATYYPNPELIIGVKNGKYENGNFRLCYKININAEDPYQIYDVYIDASTGEVVNKISKITDSDVAATATTLYSGNKSITTDSYSGSYRLRESGRPIQTYNMKNGTNYAGAVDFTNASTTWNTQDVSLNSVTISTVNSNWEDVLGEASWNGGAPDLYIEILDASSNVIYSKVNAYYENTFPPVTINTGGLLLSNGPYTLNIYDYDVTSSDDLLGSFSFTSVSGTGSFSASGTSGSISRSGRNNPALDVHWAMEKTYDFYLSTLGRNSFDNAGGIIKNYVHKDIAWNNANWNGTAMSYGDGDGSLFSPLTSIDVVGHEFTHAVVQWSAGLQYQGESGGLNESFADIFGTAIEFSGATSPNWSMGESIVLQAPYFLRSMSNPNGGLQPQPDTYNGSYWVNPSSTQDFGGVHTNSGVQNFWYYLLCQGGSGTNDIGNAYSVTSIGINAATKIAYRNLTTYLTSTSSYMDAYYGSLQAAEDLYGAGSTQQNAVRAAWYAVGIGNNPNGQCSGTQTYSAPSGSFSDGSGSAIYQVNLDCYWLIQPTGANTIALNFPAFDTEAGYDSVMVYDGATTSDPLLMTWWGNTLPPTINSSNGALLVRFMSDNTVTNAGWNATYTSSGTAYCDGGTLLTSPSGSFNDGSGGNNYGNNQACYWLIAPPCANNVTLSFSSLNTEAGYDGVVVYDGNNTSAAQLGVFSGTTLPANVTSTGGEMLVVFVSDYAVRMQGFAASYTSSGTAYCSGTTTLNTSDWGNITDGSGTNNYCNNMDCRWLIQPPQATSVTFNFTALDVEPMSTDGFSVYDAVEIYNGTSTAAPLLGRFTGNTIPPSVTSTGGSMYIRFISDISINMTGWAGYYTSTTTNYCTGTTTLTAPSGTFNDGSGTTLYGNGADCEWLIQPTSAAAITLTFSSFDTELNYDGVIVYDGNNTSAATLGTFSGSTLPTAVTSTGGSMLVRFVSDEAVRQNGWVANYNSTTVGIKDIQSQNENVKIYPNPFKNMLTVEFNTTKESEIDITVTNLLGQTVKHLTSKVNAGNSKQVVELNDLPADAYWIKVLVNDEQRIFKTIKMD